jgi:hypothetical protein
MAAPTAALLLVADPGNPLQVVAVAVTEDIKHTI